MKMPMIQLHSSPIRVGDLFIGRDGVQVVTMLGGGMISSRLATQAEIVAYKLGLRNIGEEIQESLPTEGS